MRSRGFTLIELIIVIAIIAIIAAIAIPNIISARKNANESSAVQSLKTLTTAQHVFAVGDKDQDEAPDFGSLDDLSNTSMIDGILGSGVKQGYVFACVPAGDSPEAVWFATANPVAPLASGDRYFATNQRGVVYYTGQQSVAGDLVTGSLPAELSPLR